MTTTIINLIESYPTTNLFIFLAILITIAVFCNKRGRNIAIIMTCTFVVSLGVFLWLYNNLFEHNIVVNSSFMIVIGFIAGAFFRFVDVIHSHFAFSEYSRCLLWGKPDTYLIPKYLLDKIDKMSIDELHEKSYYNLEKMKLEHIEFNKTSLSKKQKIQKIKENMRLYNQIFRICSYKIRKVYPLDGLPKEDYEKYISIL